MIGILGGTFDPIHFGHLRLAEELAEAVALNEVRFIPAATPPHREAPQVGAHHRGTMVTLAIAGNPRFKLDDRELGRSGPSYTVDTLSVLRAEHPETPLCLLLGGDAFLGLPTWHRWQELLALTHIVVAYRPGAIPSEAAMPAALHQLYQLHQTQQSAALRQDIAGRILLQPMTALDISASAIRQRLARGLSTRYLLPDAVRDYIEQHHLYPKESNGT